MNRRRFLIGAGVTTSAAVAGCLGEEEDPDSNGEDDSLSNGDDSEPNDTENGDVAADDGELSDDENGTEDDDPPADGDDGSGDSDDESGADDDGSDETGDESGEEPPDDGDENDDEGDDDNDVGDDDSDSGSDAGSDDGSDDSDGGETEPETHTLEIEIGIEPGYNRPSVVTLEIAGERLETGEPIASFDLESGTHTLEATAEGFETATQTVSVEEETTVGIELQRQYEDIRIVDHDVSITRRDDADDTVGAAVVLENRSDFESTRIWVEASATDGEGNPFGYAESQALSVSPGERTDVRFTLLRSTGNSFEDGRSVGSYELAVTTVGTFRTLDTASG